MNSRSALRAIVGLAVLLIFATHTIPLTFSIIGVAIVLTLGVLAVRETTDHRSRGLVAIVAIVGILLFLARAPLPTWLILTLALTGIAIGVAGLVLANQIIGPGPGITFWRIPEGKP